MRDARAGFLAGLVVVSHWLLDFLTHRPDLTLAGGDAYYGLGLWNLPWIAMPLEIAITVGALYWYVKRTRGPVGPPFVLLALLLGMQAINWFAPHPTEAGIGLFIQALVAFGVLTLIAGWVGDNRKHKRTQGWR